VAADAYLHFWRHTVYGVYATAARHWWAGQDLYAYRDEPYRYSPLFAVAMTPFAALPDCWGCPLWKVANAALFAAGLAAWARRVLPGEPTRQRTGVLFLLALPVALPSLYIGQANLAMLGALLLGLAGAAAGRWNRSAGWLAAATLIKGYPVAAALLLAALCPRRFAPRFAAALALGLALPFLSGRPAVVAGQYASWLHHLRASTVIMRERLRSLDHLFALAGHPLAPRTFAVLGVAAGLAVFAVCLVQAQRLPGRRERLTWLFQLFAPWVLLFGPATESSTYAVAAPAVAWALIDAYHRRTSWVVRLVLPVCLVLMGPVCTDLVGTTLRNFAATHGAEPIGALLFVAYLAAEALRGPRTSPAPSSRPTAAAA
jgi:hypothetical protein